MSYSLEPKDRIYVKVYEFLSFAKNIGKTLSKKCSQKLFDSAKKSKTHAKKLFQKKQLLQRQLVI